MVVDVGQTVESSDVAVTLEQIDITPSEARVWLRYSPTKSDTFLKGDDWTMSGSLYIGSRSDNGVDNWGVVLPENPEDEENPGARGGCNSISNNPCFLSYLDPLFPDTDPLDGTLTLIANRSSPPHGPGPWPPPYGTWTFHFTVPAISRLDP